MIYDIGEYYDLFSKQFEVFLIKFRDYGRKSISSEVEVEFHIKNEIV